MDLCVPHGPEMMETLTRLWRLGYYCVAIETAIADVATPPPPGRYTFPSNPRALRASTNPVLLESEYELTCLSRLTLVMSGSTRIHPIAQRYDILAMRVSTETQLKYALSQPIDVVQVPSTVTFRLTHALMRQLRESGITMELLYPDTPDEDAGNTRLAFHINRCGRTIGALISRGKGLPPLRLREYLCSHLKMCKMSVIQQNEERVLSRAAARRFRLNHSYALLDVPKNAADRTLRKSPSASALQDRDGGHAPAADGGRRDPPT
ncbi:RNase P subunit p30 [Giardia muris]|uniref:RNase P subunit p30 n=1 Tax=Giardia muris TaxID=5742 RepID=A0A4Z1T4E5_GIAMU|nr:RNase P subunit p30 [Giardia muris]|eukprot:TNJ27917.1 RNase P subunit p30 [Giardia muris]